MVRRILRHVRQNAVAWLALFVALGGTGAYAANTIGTGDIIDDQVTSADVRDDTLGFGGLGAQDLAPDSVGASEIKFNSVAGNDIQNATITGFDVGSNALTGNHINEASLQLPPTTTSTFALSTNVQVNATPTRVLAKNLPAGRYLVVASTNIRLYGRFSGDASRDVGCELRNPDGAYIGGVTDRRVVPDGQEAIVSLSPNGGATVGGGGGEVSLWCRIQNDLGTSFSSQMMIVRMDGVF